MHIFQHSGSAITDNDAAMFGVYGNGSGLKMVQLLLFRSWLTQNEQTYNKKHSCHNHLVSSSGCIISEQQCTTRPSVLDDRIKCEKNLFAISRV